MDRPDYLNDDDDFDRVVEEERRKRRAQEHVGSRRNSARRPSEAAASKSPVCVELLSAAAIAPIAIRWLWRDWLAAGRLQIMAGAPGAGKTTIALKVAATVSTGGLWPDGTGAEAGNVVIWSGEDDPADTLVPRLIAGGADVGRVHFVRSVREDGATRPFDPARDMPPLAEAIKKAGEVKLVIIDPLVMVAVKDSHRNAETRRDLQPVADLCRDTGAAVLGIHHFAKGSSGRDPQERVIGSVAFAAVARLVWVVAKSQPREGLPARNVLMRAKSNIGPDDGGFDYSIAQVALEKHSGICASRVEWGECIEGHARDVLAEAEGPEEQRTPRDEAADFLKSVLANGPLQSEAIFSAARKEGIATKTLKRAKAALGIVSQRSGFGPGSNCQWALSSVEFPIEGQNSHRGPLKTVAPYEQSGPLCTGSCTGEEHVEVEM